MKVHIDKPDAAMLRIVRAAFPDYNGRKFEIRTSETFGTGDNHWSRGSRTYQALVSRTNEQVVTLPQCGTPFDKTQPGTYEIPHGVILVEHVYFCGRDLGIRFTVRPDEAAAFLPPPPADDLSLTEQTVIAYTIGRVSSYNGEDRCRQAQRDGCRIPRAAWEEAQQALIAKGYLTKNRAATTTAKNWREANGGYRLVDRIHDRWKQQPAEIAQ